MPYIKLEANQSVTSEEVVFEQKVYDDNAMDDRTIGYSIISAYCDSAELKNQDFSCSCPGSKINYKFPF